MPRHDRAALPKSPASNNTSAGSSHSRRAVPSSRGKPKRADIYTRVTAEIIAAIENGAGAWRAPWFHDGTPAARPTNVASARRYRGINTVALWVAAMVSGYNDGLWGTYRQWQDAGAQVRKGERSTTVVLWKPIASRERTVEEDTDDSHCHRMVARAFPVFNLAQVDGYERPPIPLLPENERVAHAEAFIANLGVRTVFGGSDACYCPSSDTVFMPEFACFRDAPSFYGVLLHEMGHASGARHRLDRDLSGRFGSAAYAAEECCVELLSGLVLADLGIAHHPRPDHAAYIASWVKVMAEDPRAIFTAAGKAQQAADWMHEQQPLPASSRDTDERKAGRAGVPDAAGRVSQGLNPAMPEHCHVPPSRRPVSAAEAVR